jgi:hypothetical protein
VEDAPELPVSLAALVPLNSVRPTSSRPGQLPVHLVPLEQAERVPTASCIEAGPWVVLVVAVAEPPEATVGMDHPAVDLVEVVGLAEPVRLARAEMAAKATL